MHPHVAPHEIASEGDADAFLGANLTRGAFGVRGSLAALSSCKVCVVDDELVNCKIVRKYLVDNGMPNVVTTTDPLTALDFLRKERPDVVVLDLMMPEVSGLDILGEIAVDPVLSRVPVLILTACDEQEVRSMALDLGACDFLTKPVDPTDLTPRVRNALAVRSYQKSLAEQNERLEEIVRARTQELITSRMEVVHCLGRAADYRDNETGRHVQRVGLYVGVIARALGLPCEQVELLELAAPLHDVGKIGVADAILHKPAKLTNDEFGDMQRHCQFGFEILGNVRDPRGRADDDADAPSKEVGYHSPILRLAATIAMTHHEKWDGTGYPHGLKGEEIPLEGRVTAVADVFDALSTKRPYKPAFSIQECFDILEKGRGSHFDPSALDAFFSAREEVLEIHRRYAD